MEEVHWSAKGETKGHEFKSSKAADYHDKDTTVQFSMVRYLLTYTCHIFRILDLCNAVLEHNIHMLQDRMKNFKAYQEYVRTCVLQHAHSCIKRNHLTLAWLLSTSVAAIKQCMLSNSRSSTWCSSALLTQTSGR